MVIVVNSSRSQSKALLVRQSARTLHMSSHSILSTPQSYPQFIDVENKYGEVDSQGHKSKQQSQDSYQVCMTSE